MSDPRPEPADTPTGPADDTPGDASSDLPSGAVSDEPTAPPSEEEVAPGPPRLEVAAVAVLLGSVVLAVVPATEGVAPVAWVAGMVMVLLSRRWGPADKGLALLAFGILGVPFVLLGRDELRAPASVVTGIVLVALWLGTVVLLLRRSRHEREEGRGIRMR